MLIDLDLRIKYVPSSVKLRLHPCLADRADSGKTGGLLVSYGLQGFSRSACWIGKKRAKRSMSGLTDEIAYFHQLGHQVSTVKPVFLQARNFGNFCCRYVSDFKIKFRAIDRCDSAEAASRRWRSVTWKGHLRQACSNFHQIFFFGFASDHGSVQFVKQNK